MSRQCPLCRHSAAQPYHRDNFRTYYQCSNCALVFVPPEYHLPLEEERAYYDLHENSLQDEGYQRFLSRCATPLLNELRPHSEGLDFGCGPAPLLARMLAEAGHRVELYDSYYVPNTGAMKRDYDFIVATEVVEHLSAPGEELQRLWQRLRPGGVLALMTKLVISPERFANWHYIRDPTHISFFSVPTFRWLAETLQAELEFADSDVIFLHRSGVHPE
ncbi:Methyltransferase domain-containing protein [Microbulbifer donghaiensis]|uniref:Methyltransferase domain-containing protein n=1 Tax=Microbulbifer donghaiensis TaxID=494016 RepID=A0A1M5GP83_9GAMM|nr:class I SAM-dependent methyltransferase [Microbulbifer donghaiensis]SHG05513.1 Methyltransferase domain-containing protein [Microbulbifer donghaiensis]